MMDLVSGSSHDRGEDGAGRVVAGESGLAHSAAIVHHQSGHFLVAHLGLVIGWLIDRRERELNVWIY